MAQDHLDPPWNGSDEQSWALLVFTEVPGEECRDVSGAQSLSSQLTPGPESMPIATTEGL